MATKSIKQIIIEAIIVGILFIIIYNIINKLFFNKLDKMLLIFISAALFHIICEITGVNIWYVNNYYSIINK